MKVNPIYGHPRDHDAVRRASGVGHPRLRDLEYYRDDAMVKRVLGLKRLPDVATVSRALASADERSVEKVPEVSTSMVLERLAQEKLARVTLDFDGSVLSTGRHAEGTAVGFNKKKKGERSYYPWFVPWRRPIRCSRFITAGATCTTPTALIPSSHTAYVG